jgi:hypothetical protein
MKKRITAQKITSKQGQSAKTGKVFTKYGLCDQENTWYNSFNPINAVEGGEYDIEYEPSQYGNDLKSISAVSETENKLQNTNRQNSIIRQHSQGVALQELAIKAQTGELKEFPSRDELIRIIDWYADDANQDLPF